MKRIPALMLVLAMLAAFAVPTARAADSYADRQNAVVQTAVAFYLKNPNMQYDSTQLTSDKVASGGVNRTNHDVTPEDATPDRDVYTVCSSFCYECYDNALGYHLLGNIDNCLTTNLYNKPPEDMVVYKYNSTDSTETKDEAIKKFMSVLQPADVLVVIKSRGDGGHALLYVGDLDGDGKGDIIHSTGGKYEMSTGVDQHEEKGNIQFVQAEDFMLNGYLQGMIGFCVLRPLKGGASDCAVTASARARMANPWLSVNRTLSCGYYGNPAVGGELTCSIVLRNGGKNALNGLAVKETVPAGTELVTAEGASASGRDLSWNVSLAAGESKTVSYTVKVTAARGKTLTFGGGSVAGIASNTRTVRVGGKAVDAAKLQQTDWYENALKGETGGVEFARNVYRYALGIDLTMPVGTSLCSGVFLSQGKGHFARGAGLALSEMAVDDWLGGQFVYAASDDRALNPRIADLTAGDLVVSSTGIADKNPIVYLYTGKKLIYPKDGEITTVKEAVVTKLLTKSFFFCLRPSLAYDDIAAQSKFTPPAFTDVKGSDWFYGYVCDLVHEGTVSGVSATRFAPSSNLTYGQALKLVTLAVGEKEQAKSGSHWASGYLALAKSKGWLTQDVNLDGQITRLSFCQIAAKAAGLTQQPTRNPFTDTADTAVLALNKAGVISGMTQTTFAPQKLLTRAQITKIIWYLERV